MYKCEKCGKEVTIKYGSGRFCSRACANSRIHSEKTKQSISNSCKQYKYYTNIHTHEVKGFKEDDIIPDDYIRGNIKNINKCNIDLKIIYDTKNKCSICGSIDCTNNFCKKGNKRQQLNTLIRYFGFDPNKVGTEEVFQEWERVRKSLFTLYHDQHLSSSEISKIYNYPSYCNLSGKVFKYLDIPTKSCTLATTENYIYNRMSITEIFNSRYKTELHTTWYGSKVFLRSSYESDYANYLDINRIYYEVESLRIKYIDSVTKLPRCAIPDFYLPSENLIVEIKSDYTLDKLNMIDKATLYILEGYKFQLILEHKNYNLEELKCMYNY